MIYHFKQALEHEEMMFLDSNSNKGNLLSWNFKKKKRCIILYHLLIVLVYCDILVLYAHRLLLGCAWF